jgi:hypothetical protein
MDPDSDTHPDADPAIFGSDLPRFHRKIFSMFFCLLLFEGSRTLHLHHFSKLKSHNKVTKQ